MDKRKTQTNRSKDKEIDDHAQDDIDRLSVSRKEKGQGLTSSENCINTKIDSVQQNSNCSLYGDKNKTVTKVNAVK